MSSQRQSELQVQQAAAENASRVSHRERLRREKAAAREAAAAAAAAAAREQDLRLLNLAAQVSSKPTDGATFGGMDIVLVGDL